MPFELSPELAAFLCMLDDYGDRPALPEVDLYSLN